MFFKSKQKKMDPKVRFQDRSFAEKLKSAREYERRAVKAPETPKEKFLAQFGLDSWWSRTLVIGGILGLIYLVFIPNFLYIKTIEIKGVDDGEKGKIVNSINQYFNSVPLYKAQRNAIFLSEHDLEQYLLSNQSSIYKVNSIKKIPGKLTLDLALKYEKFIFDLNDSSYLAFNDGSLVNSVPLEELSQAENLIHIYIDSKDDIGEIVRQIDESHFDKISFLNTRLKDEFKIGILNFEIPTVQKQDELQQSTSEEDKEIKTIEPPKSKTTLVPNELVVNTKPAEGMINQTSYQVYFDASTDLNNATEKFKALISQMSPQNSKNLFYIDMRFLEKSFVCLKNTACAVVREPVKDVVEPSGENQIQNQ